ncbi:MAG: ABC transporter permease [Rubrivivax sp.]|nr:ABC transporter permease [Rubrivivax sp.]
MKRDPLSIAAALLLVGAFSLPLAAGVDGGAALAWRASLSASLAWGLLVVVAVWATQLGEDLGATLGWTALCAGAALAFGLLPPATGALPAASGFWLAALALALLALHSVRRCAAITNARIGAPLTAALFGLWVLFFWQLGVSTFDVPRVLLPAPLDIALSLVEHGETLGRDFVQTVVKAVLIGWALGSALGFAVAVAIDRLPFLQRGLLPVASLTSTVPLVAVAPIMVMWFGFEWPSKAAVVVLMTFFPMLVATLAGLQAAGRLERELMHSYAAGYLRTLVDLRLPSAVPFIVGALKINATLALIGAIVAEFFGSPTVGLGFRISTEAARMNMSLVWGAIVVAAVTGSLAYALLVQLERKLAFWHPSVRSR